MKKLLLMTALFTFVCSSQAMAETVTTPNPEKLPPQVGCPMKMHPPKFDKEKFEKELNLTDAQKEKIKTMREADFEKMKPIMEKLKAKHQEEKAILDSKLTETQKAEKLKPIREDIKALRGEMRTIHQESKKSFESVLTQKQLKKLEAMKESHKKEMESKMQNVRKHDCNCR